ncbi:MAG: TniQ family protein [Betaproteobacteria bacterium]|nr:TniQ family protein [Betaproteobacteria bacterium]
MLSSKLWPAHPKPLPDELLSSWIVRIARANGVKLQTMTHQLFGDALTPWNRDIDRLAPKWLLKAVSEHTGTPYWDAYRTTLTCYRDRLYPRRLSSGQLRWILPLKLHSTNRQGYGLQYCPECLAEDVEPYFRRKWRVGFFTFCPNHKALAHDACPGCDSPVAFHRRDFGHGINEAGEMCLCNVCRFDLRRAPHIPASVHDPEVFALHKEMLLALDMAVSETGRFDIGFHAVLHQLCKIMVSKPNHDRLRMYVAERLGIVTLDVAHGPFPFEQRRVAERHHVLSLALWLMQKPELRLTEAWEAKVVRYNTLSKDFKERPAWFRGLAARFSDWRKVNEFAANSTKFIQKRPNWRPE